MKRTLGRSGVVLVTVLAMTCVCALVLGSVVGYVSNATRRTSVFIGDNA